MFGLKLSRIAALAVVAILGAQGLVWGQLPIPPAPTVEPTAAAAQFHPPTEADVQSKLVPVRAAAAALEQRFGTAGDSAAGWKEYLGWNRFQSELQKPNPDKMALNEMYTNLAAGYDGLELKWFADLRAALGEYVYVVADEGKTDLEAAFTTRVAELKQEIKSLSAHPTNAEMRKVADHLLWLEARGQAPELVKEVRQRFAAPNFHAQVGADLLGAGAGGPIDDVAPIDDVILGTSIHGTGHTVGQTKVALTPMPDFASFDAMVQAVNYSNNVGSHGPVCIYTTGVTCLGADKRFWLDATGLHAHPAQAAAQVNTTINDIVSVKGRRFVEKMAWRRAGKQLGEAEAIASGHASYRFGARVDGQAQPRIVDANNQLEGKVRKPLDERRAYPAAFSFDTLAAALEIHGTEARGTQLAAPTPPPDLTQPADVTLRVHESTINNFAESVFTGMRLTDDMVQRTSLELTGKIPDLLKPDPNQEPFTIIFPPESIPRVEPVTVTFRDGGYSVTLRGQKYITGEKTQQGMNITANYTFKKLADGYHAVRNGDLEIYGTHQRPGAPRSLAQQVIYSVLQRKFGKIFLADIKLQGFKFNTGKLAAAGQLLPQEIISQDGWLAVGYVRAKAASAESPPAASAGQTAAR
jgi:hypothetical protein